MRDVLRIIGLMVMGAMLMGLVTHARGTAAIIDSVTGFFRTGLSAQLGAVGPAGGRGGAKAKQKKG